MNKSIKLGFVPASRDIFDQQLAVKMRELTLKSFAKCDIEAVVPDSTLTRNGLVQSLDEAEKCAKLMSDAKVDGVVIGAVNFGNEIPAALAAIQGAPDKPIFIFGCEEEGALSRREARRDAFCGLISIATALRHRGARFTFPGRANCFPDDEEFIRDLANFARVCRAVNGIKGCVYGQIGPRPAEFETCAFNEISLLRHFNIRVVPIPLTQVIRMAQQANSGKVDSIIDQYKEEVDISALTNEDLEKIARLEAAIDAIAKEHGLAGMAIQCWTSLQEDYGIVPCYTMSRLTSRGIPCACEVDIHGTLSMHLLMLISGSPAALVDWNNRHYRLRNVFSAWHCGVFPKEFSREKSKLGYHHLFAESKGETSGCYGALELIAQEGPVTLSRITETEDGRWLSLQVEGMIISAEGEPPGSHAWVEVSDLDALYACILRNFPHHVAMVKGHYGDALRDVAYFLGMESVEPILPLREAN